MVVWLVVRRGGARPGYEALVAQFKDAPPEEYIAGAPALLQTVTGGGPTRPRSTTCTCIGPRPVS